MSDIVIPANRVQIVNSKGEALPYTIKKEFKQEEHTPKMGNEITWASSSMFPGYTFRPYNPDDLYQQRGNYDLYDNIRQDDQVYAALNLKKHIILNAGWEIESEDEDVKEFIVKALNEYMDDTFENKLKQILSALDYGFSVTEKISEIVDTEDGKKVVFTKLKTRAPHSWEIRTDLQGNLLELAQYTDGQDAIIPPEKVILYSYQKEFDNMYGQSDINKGVYTAWWSKTNIIKFWNIALEKYAMPTAIGKLPRSASNEKADVLKALKNIQSRTGMTLPGDIEVQFLEINGSGFDAYEKAINKYDTMIARKMLIPDLMGLSGGETGGGSYALGQEQFDLFYSVIRSTRQDLERIINREIVNHLVFWNYGKGKKAIFKFAPVDQDQKMNDLKLWLEAVKTGKIPVTEESTNWFLDKVNAPEVSEEEFAEIEAKKEEFKEAMTNGDKKGDEEKTEKEVEKEIEKEAKKPDKDQQVKDKKEFEKYYRPLSMYEKGTDFAKIEKGLDVIEEKYISSLGGAYTLIINGMLNDILKKQIVQKKKLGAINKLTLRNTGKAKGLYKDMIKESMTFGYGSTGKKFGLDDEDIAKWIEEESLRLSWTENNEILKKTKQVLADGIRSGDGIQATSAKLEEALKSWDVKLSSTVKGHGVRVETIVRTETNRAFNTARATEFKGMVESGDIVGFEFSAIMDGRTSAVCESLDGTKFPPAQIDYYNPPLHPNCRSVLVAIWEGQEFDGFDTPPHTKKRTGGGLELVKSAKQLKEIATAIAAKAEQSKGSGVVAEGIDDNKIEEITEAL